MKKLAIIMVIVAALASCTAKDDKEETVVENAGIPDSTAVTADAHYFWTADVGTNGGLEMKRVSPISSDSLTPAHMIDLLNGLYPEVKIYLEKVSNDSIYLNIQKSTYLTQQMGSSGAEAYLAEVTYNFTELSNINFVNIKFKKGDHAAPGTFVRTDFVN